MIRPTTTNDETIIVGAGLAGLICGNHLADRGHPVTILESNDEPGGRARTAVDERGFHFNFGPHALYDNGALAEQLDDLDIAYSGNSPGGPFFGLRGEQIGRLPDGLWPILSTDLLGFGSRFSFIGLMTTIQSADPEEIDGHRSAADWLDENASRSDVRAVAEAFVRLSTYTADLEEMPADIMLDSLKRATAGVTYIDGGWQVLVDRLVERFESAGGRLRCNAPVTAIRKPEGAQFEVEIRGAEPLTARRIVLATPPRACQTLLDNETARRTGIPDNPEPVQAACLDLALDKLPHPDRPLALGLETPTYISDHGPYTDVAPQDATVVHAARYLRRDESIEAKRARADIETALDTFQPGWRDQVVDSRFLSRISVVSHMPSPEDGGFAGRPSPVVDGVAGLYLAGDWVGEAGWLSNASAASARRVADAVDDSMGAPAARRSSPRRVGP